WHSRTRCRCTRAPKPFSKQPPTRGGPCSTHCSALDVRACECPRPSGARWLVARLLSWRGLWATANGSRARCSLPATSMSRVRWFPWFGPVNACIDLPYGRHLALVAQTLGRLDDAIDHLEDAEARTARAGMRAHLARLWYELARALL